MATHFRVAVFVAVRRRAAEDGCPYGVVRTFSFHKTLTTHRCELCNPCTAESLVVEMGPGIRITVLGGCNLFFSLKKLQKVLFI